MKKAISFLLPVGMGIFMLVLATIALSSATSISSCTRRGRVDSLKNGNPDPGTAIAVPDPEPILSLRMKAGICVNTFINDPDNSWGKKTNCIAAIKYLAPWMIRTWIRKGNTWQRTFIGDIKDSIHGQQFCGVMDRPIVDGVANPPESVISWIQTYPTGTWTMLEGVNEWNIFRPESDATTWATTVREYHKAIYPLAKAAFPSTPVLAPSLGGRKNHADLGDLTAYCDFGTAHTYWGGVAPGAPGDRIDAEQQNLETVSGTREIQVTECGGHDAMNSTDRGNPAPPEVAAIQLLPYLAEYDLPTRRFGWMTLYSLVDDLPNPANDKGERHFGLFTLTTDPITGFVPKAHGEAFHNLTTILDKGRGANVNWGTCSITATGPDDAMCRYYTRPDGRRVLVIWRRNVKIYDPQTRKMVSPAPPAREVTIRFEVPRSVQLYRPHKSAEPFLSSASTTSVTVPLVAEAIVIVMEPL